MAAATPPPASRLQPRDTVAIVLVALTLTGLNAFKPLVIDDDAYYEYARHILDDPTDPYGFELLWFDRIQHANEILVPPILPYTLAISMAIFGERPVAWKLSLLPFALLLSWAMWRLLAHTAPRGRIPLLCLALLSPTVLPAFNLMLDLPMLALALTALTLLIRAGDDDAHGMGIAVAAGLVGGIAMLTKYNAVLPFVAGLIYVSLAGHWRRVLVAGTCASILFIGWEAFVVAHYGASHFFNAVDLVATFPHGTLGQWLFCFASVVGAGLSALALLGLTALHTPLLLLVLIGGEILLVLGVVAMSPGASVGSLGYFYPTWSKLSPVDWMLSITGVVALLALGAGLFGGSLAPLVARIRNAGFAKTMKEPAARLDTFLLLWLSLELIGFFALSPFPALRRIIGLNVAAVCALGRVATRAKPEASPEAKAAGRRLRGIAAFGAGLGLFFAVTDFTDAVTRRDGVARLVERLDFLRSEHGDGAAWFVGHWGFRYYAGQGGLQGVIPDRSLLRAGDWLVIPHGVHRPRLRPAGDELELIDVLAVSSDWPWSTLPGAYAGYRSIRPQPDDQMRIQIHRVVRDYVPRSY